MTRSPLQTGNFRLSDIPEQSGRTILITGANNGLGLQAATALAGAGARIILACRNQATGREALDRVRLRVFDRSTFPRTFAEAGLSDIDQTVRGFAQFLTARKP